MFRIELHKLLATDKKAQQVYLEMCREYIPIIFSTTFFTFNPQNLPGEDNLPFILRPAQIPAIETLNWCIDNKHDVGLNKTRKQGASEMCCKLFTAKALLEQGRHFIIGSRTKALVDNFGDPTTLFSKVDNCFNCLPSWWKKLCGYDPKINRKDMVLTIPATNSSFAGDTTNENFSAGSRGTAVLLDEFGRVDYSVAESIEGSVHDVAECVIYSSTHWLGAGHTFNKALEKDTTKIIQLMWYDNPEEMKGLYKTSSIGDYEIVDKEYYKNKDLKNALVLSNIAQYNPNETKIQFIADGLKGIYSPYRAPWFDFQEKKRKGNKRDFVCNVCATPHGSSDTPFDQEVLKEIKNTTITYPDLQGEILYSLGYDSMIDEDDIQFVPRYGEQRLKWWGSLKYGRPDQRHNYVIGCDPSYGLGSANSAAVIMDVNTGEQVGAWTDSTTKPEDFADMMVAMANWIGGINPAFLIWESNAGCGGAFTERVIFQGYFSSYTQRREDSKTRKKAQKWGWQSNEKAKEALLSEFSIALSGGFIEDSKYKKFIIKDELLLEELFDYVFKEKGKGIMQSSRADLSTGASERHGDRGIAAALCVLGCKEQIKGDYKFTKNAPVGSFQYYKSREEDRIALDKRNNRRFLY